MLPTRELAGVELVDWLFTHQDQTPETSARAKKILNAGKSFARDVVSNYPQSVDVTNVIHAIHEATMFALGGLTAVPYR
jgi:hypothetical protein